jgi:hypothetical protein
MSIALPFMCWLSRATPRLTLASHALVSGERKAENTSTVPLKPVSCMVCHSTSNSSGSISVCSAVLLSRRK